MNVASPYEALGVEENASLEQCTAAYKKLVKKYHPDLNPNDVIAREAMKEINRAYDAIKNNDFSHWHNQSEPTQSTQKTDPKKEQSTYENNNKYKNRFERYAKNSTYIPVNFIYNRKKNKIDTILSIGLFTAFTYLLFEYIFKYCNYDNLMYFFTEEFKNNDFFIPNFDRVKEYLPNINTELYIDILAKLLLACAVTITAMFLLTALYNIIHICVFDKIKKEQELLRANIHNEDSYIYLITCTHNTTKLLKASKIINIVYAVFTYLTIVLFFITVAMYTVFQTALFIPFSFKAYKILMIGIAILMFVIYAIFISEKCDRIKENECLKNGDCIENLDTMLKGVGTATIPMLIILSIVLLIIYIVLSLVGGGRRDD